MVWRRAAEPATLARGKRWSLRHPSRGCATLVNLTAFLPSFETQGPVWLVKGSQGKALEVEGIVSAKSLKQGRGE